MECISKCTDIKRPYHTPGIADFGSYQCVECGGLFTDKGVQRSLKIKFGDAWENEWLDLKVLRRKVRAGVRKIRKRGSCATEGIYHKSGFINSIEHKSCVVMPDDGSEPNIWPTYSLSSFPFHPNK